MAGRPATLTQLTNEVQPMSWKTFEVNGRPLGSSMLGRPLTPREKREIAQAQRDRYDAGGRIEPNPKFK